MLSWALIIISALANFGLAFLALSPSLVTFAQVVPDGVDCMHCGGADVQSALRAAAEAGRSQVVGVIAPVWLLIGLASASTAASTFALLVCVRRTNRK